MLRQHGVVDRGLTRERSRMRSRGAGSSRRAANLQCDHRLAVAARQLQRPHEACAVAHRFHVDNDDLHVGALRHPEHAFSDVDVRLVACRGPVADSHALLPEQIGQVRSAGPALAGDGHRPRHEAAREKRLREGAYEARVQIECAQAVGTKKTHARGASNLYQFSLLRCTVLVAFGEPGRKDDDHLHTCARAGAHSLEHGVGRQGHDSQTHFAWDEFYRRVGRQALDVCTIEVDRINRSGKTVLLQIQDGAPTNAAGVIGSPDDGHGLRVEEHVQALVVVIIRFMPMDVFC